MRIVIVNVVAHGSTGRISTDLYTAYERAGHDVLIAYGRGTLPHRYHQYRIGSTWSVLEHVAETRLCDNHGLASRRATRSFLGLLRQYDPDVIHLHNIHGYYLNFPRLFSYLRDHYRGRVIWTMHDMWAVTGHSAHVPQDLLKNEGAGHSSQLRAQYPRAYVDRYHRNLILKRTSFTGLSRMIIVCPSAWLATVIRDSFLSEYPILVIPNGIDLAEFRPQSVETSTERVVLAVANVWTHEKGLGDIVALADLLPAGYRIRLIGRVPRGTRLPSTVEHVDFVSDRSSLALEYSRASVFVNPTRNETFSLVNLEAQACGTPVVAYNTDGVPETLRAGTSTIVPQGSITQMCAAIVALEKTDTLVRQCLSYARGFSNRLMEDRYLRLVNEIPLTPSCHSD